VLIDVPDCVQRVDLVRQQVALGISAGFNAVFPHLIGAGEWLDTLERSAPGLAVQIAAQRVLEELLERRLVLADR